MKNLEKVNNSKNQTPIEVALEIDENGKTTAKKLYDFLELSPSQYARWCKKNIEENIFATENVDFTRSTCKSNGNPNPTTDYKLTANFAKKLCMTSKTERGEQARNYFIKVEEALKNVVVQERAGQQQYYYFDSIPYTIVRDVASSFGCKVWTVRDCIIKYLKYGVDYLLLQGKTLMEFKYQNPIFKTAKSLYLITMAGLGKIKKHLQIQGYTQSKLNSIEDYLQVTPDSLTRKLTKERAEYIIKKYCSLSDLEKYELHITNMTWTHILKGVIETVANTLDLMSDNGLYEECFQITT